MKRDSKPETTFGGPRVLSTGSNPIAERVKQQMQERGKYTMPVGGGSSPPMPRLDMPASEGATMAEQATVQRTPYAPPASALAAAGIIQQSAPAQQLKPSQAKLALLPGDILPEQAKQDPTFQQGMGSHYATSQPELARKYGVIRSGRLIPPQQLAGRVGGISSETAAGLKAVNEFQQHRQQIESPEHAAEVEAEAGLAAKGATLGQTSGAKPLTDDEKKRLQNAAQNMDDFDFHTLREMMMKDILNNEEQRKLIESRLEPMDLTDYIIRGAVTQNVRINSKLEYTFVSMDGQTDLALKRLVTKELKNFTADDRYVLDKYAIMTIACGIQSINNLPLPDHMDKDGNFNEDLFLAKFNRVAKFGLHMLASIGINHFWFDIRVRKLLMAESLGNG